MDLRIRNQESGEVIAHDVKVLPDNSSSLLCWGCGQHGQHGHAQLAMADVASENGAIQDFGGTDQGPQIITAVACGSSHTVVLTEDNKLYAWGHGYSQHCCCLGETKTPNCAATRLDTVASTVDTNSRRHGTIAGIACGGRRTVCWLADGTVFCLSGTDVQKQHSVTCSTTGESQGLDYTLALAANKMDPAGLGTRKVHSLMMSLLQQPWGGAQVQQVACGERHSLFLLSNGELYVEGSNTYGQLGTGDRTESMSPKKICVKPVLMVACGSHHSLAVTGEGDLLVWGYGKAIGFREADIVHPTKRVKHYTNIKMLAGGSAHCVSLTENGNVYTWGVGVDGQLGHGADDHFVVYPKKVSDCRLLGQVAQISAGDLYSAAILASGDLYMWGKNSHTIDSHLLPAAKVYSPAKVNVTSCAVKVIACGAWHAACIVGLPEVDINDSTSDIQSVWGESHSEEDEKAEKETKSHNQQSSLSVVNVGTNLSLMPGSSTSEAAKPSNHFVHKKSELRNQHAPEVSTGPHQLDLLAAHEKKRVSAKKRFDTVPKFEATLNANLLKRTHQDSKSNESNVLEHSTDIALHSDAMRWPMDSSQSGVDHTVRSNVWPANLSASASLKDGATERRDGVWAVSEIPHDNHFIDKHPPEDQTWEPITSNASVKDNVKSQVPAETNEEVQCFRGSGHTTAAGRAMAAGSNGHSRGETQLQLSRAKSKPATEHTTALHDGAPDGVGRLRLLRTKALPREKTGMALTTAVGYTNLADAMSSELVPLDYGRQAAHDPLKTVAPHRDTSRPSAEAMLRNDGGGHADSNDFLKQSFGSAAKETANKVTSEPWVTGQLVHEQNVIGYSEHTAGQAIPARESIHKAANFGHGSFWQDRQARPSSDSNGATASEAELPRSYRLETRKVPQASNETTISGDEPSHNTSTLQPPHLPRMVSFIDDMSLVEKTSPLTHYRRAVSIPPKDVYNSRSSKPQAALFPQLRGANFGSLPQHGEDVVSGALSLSKLNKAKSLMAPIHGGIPARSNLYHRDLAPPALARQATRRSDISPSMNRQATHIQDTLHEELFVVSLKLAGSGEVGSKQPVVALQTESASNGVSKGSSLHTALQG